MHAAAWRSLRAAYQLHRRPACRIVAGVRRPLARNFHPSPSSCRSPEQPASAAASENKDESDNSEEVKGQSGPEGVIGDGAENTTQSNDVLRRSGRRQSYGSGIRRTSRNKAPTGLPPLVFPKWFWKRNVTCYGEPEDVTQRVDIKEAVGAVKEHEPIENNALLTLNTDNIPVLNRQAVRKLEIGIHIFENRLKEIGSLMKRLGVTQGKPQELESTVKCKEAYDGQPFEIACSEGLIEKSVLFLRHAAPMRRLLAIAQSNDDLRLKDPNYWYSLPEDVYNEIYMSFCGELRLPPPKINIKDVYRQDTLLLCPRDGGLNFLNAVVQKVATVLEADVVRLDSEDIAQIVGQYLGEDVAWTKTPTTVLGYRSSGRLDGSESSSKKDPIDDDEDANDSYEEDDTPLPVFSPEFTVRGKGSPLHAAFAFLQTPSKLLQGQSFSKGMNLVNFLGQSANSGSLAAQSANPGESWSEYKMGRAMEAIMSAPDVKRARSVVGIAEDQQSLRHPALPASKGLIIQISGYKELNEHPVGYNLLNSLREAVKKRWYEGRSIMIVGTAAESPEQTLVQAQDSFGHRFSSGVASDRPRTIFVPPECHQSRIDNDQKAQIRDLNIRHTEQMIRKLLGTDNESQWTINLTQDLVVDHKLERLVEKVVWTYNDVRRIATSMLATAGSDRLVDGSNLRYVLMTLRVSDGTKATWARRDDMAREAVKSIDETILDGTSSTVGKTVVEKDDKLDKLKKQCTAHEKKLLGGVINAADIHTTFADVRAPPETIEALKTLTSLSLIRPDSFSYGVLATDRIPGLLLYGPPGTGKTLLAKAVAKESGATMLEVSASEINDMYVGEGEKNVQALFTLAKKLSPCVVFIDEADSLFGSRGNEHQRRSHREIINQFLREWDGMENLSAFIMVATNRPFDLDEAVLRRLPRRLLVDLPVEKDREAILQIHLKDEILDESISLATLAKNTPFYSGSDLKNLSVAAALACVREENEMAAKHTGEEAYVYPLKRILRQKHFDKAMEEISASISEDMSTLSAIRKFDERYGDRKGRRKKKSGMGFGGTTDPEPDSEAGRVRKLELNV